VCGLAGSAVALLTWGWHVINSTSYIPGGYKQRVASAKPTVKGTAPCIFMDAR